jgi:hypothetical protein
MNFRLDKTAFKWQSLEDAEKTKVFKEKSYAERLMVANYLIEVAYRVKDFKKLKIDKTQFNARKHL